MACVAAKALVLLAVMALAFVASAQVVAPPKFKPVTRTIKFSKTFQQRQMRNKADGSGAKSLIGDFISFVTTFFICTGTTTQGPAWSPAAFTPATNTRDAYGLATCVGVTTKGLVASCSCNCPGTNDIVFGNYPVNYNSGTDTISECGADSQLGDAYFAQNGPLPCNACYCECFDPADNSMDDMWTKAYCV